jgi:hypothetical protein
MFLGLESSPGFREKLAEREESTARRSLLIHRAFPNDLNISTIMTALE